MEPLKFLIVHISHQLPSSSRLTMALASNTAPFPVFIKSCKYFLRPSAFQSQVCSPIKSFLLLCLLRMNTVVTSNKFSRFSVDVKAHRLPPEMKSCMFPLTLLCGAQRSHSMKCRGQNLCPLSEMSGDFSQRSVRIFHTVNFKDFILCLFVSYLIFRLAGRILIVSFVLNVALSCFCWATPITDIVFCIFKESSRREQRIYLPN